MTKQETETQNSLLAELQNVLDWSPLLEIETAAKEKVKIRRAMPDDDFWDLWRERKAEIKEFGISVSKFRGNFQVTWWNAPLNLPEKAPKDAVQEAAPIDIPEFAPLKDDSILMDFQKVPVQYHVWHMSQPGYPASTLLAEGTGIGKTFIALAVARERGRRVAVVCTKSIIKDWEKACEKMGVEAFYISNWEYVKTGKTPICSVVPLKKKKEFTITVPDDVDVIFDEAHKGRHMGTQNSKLIYAARDQEIPHMLLSATIGTDPTQLDAPGYSMGIHKGYNDYVPFMTSFGCKKTRFGYFFPKTKRNNEKLKKLHRMMFPRRGLRVRASDLGDKFPETVVEARSLTMDSAKEIAGMYSNLMEEIDKIKNKEKAANVKANVLAAIIRARQAVELLKAPTVVEMAKDYIDEGNSVFIAVNFRDTLYFIEQQFKEFGKIMGGQSVDERNNAIALFQSNKLPVIGGIIQACREGISLHDTRNERERVSLIMPCFGALDFRQVLGRVQRLKGGKSFQYVIYTEGVEVEEKACMSLRDKLDNLDIIVDGDIDGSNTFLGLEENAQTE